MKAAVTAATPVALGMTFSAHGVASLQHSTKVRFRGTCSMSRQDPVTRTSQRA
jgi:hypothetical protein